MTPLDSVRILIQTYRKMRDDLARMGGRYRAMGWDEQARSRRSMAGIYDVVARQLQAALDGESLDVTT